MNDLNQKPIMNWFERPQRKFLTKEVKSTTILTGGLTRVHDYLGEAAFKGLGYKVKSLDCPDTESLRFGKEYGNRGQCNPTYYTVGNLIKHLLYLHKVKGKTKEEIIDQYVFLTSGSCGPCRFGMYVTEYRKALRDAGFDGFRVLLFQQQVGFNQITGEETVIFDRKFMLTLIKVIFIGDILNEIGYRLRPYEVQPGKTNEVLSWCKEQLYDALSKRFSLLPTLSKCRKEINKIKVDPTRIKPKVSIIGEFWAMTTEGDGNYRLQEFIESEGGEVEVQSVTAWILYLIWEVQYDLKERLSLNQADKARNGIKGINPYHRLVSLYLADKAVRLCFQVYAKTLGLTRYSLPDMDEIAQVSHQYYNNHLRGGEGHMEVGKLIVNAKKKKANMTISVKPFGCMPSSGVSDGVQTIITELYPEAIFLPIETTGDGAVNIYSRIQMMLFKAKQVAQKEVEEALGHSDFSAEKLKEFPFSKQISQLLSKKQIVGCTAANTIYNIPKKRKLNPFLLKRSTESLEEA